MQIERVCLHSQTVSITNGVFVWPLAVFPLAFRYCKIVFFAAHHYASAIIGLSSLPAVQINQITQLTRSGASFHGTVPLLMRA